MTKVFSVVTPKLRNLHTSEIFCSNTTVTYRCQTKVVSSQKCFALGSLSGAEVFDSVASQVHGSVTKVTMGKW